MTKLFLLEDSEEELSYGFFCAGCVCSHQVRIRYKTYTRNDPLRPKDVPLWEWNGSLTKPTIFPSIDCNRSHPEKRCHSLITDGMIKYLPDSYHHLRGQTIELENDDF